MADQRKRHNESDIQAKETPEQEHENRKKQKKFEATMEPWELKEGMYLKKQKKKIAELSKRLKEMCELVKKLEKKSDIRENSLKDAFMVKWETIFVLGFNCSFPRDEIKSSLKQHFSSCGPVTGVYVPFHCKTGHPMGGREGVKTQWKLLGRGVSFCYDGEKKRRIRFLYKLVNVVIELGRSANWNTSIRLPLMVSVPEEPFDNIALINFYASKEGHEVKSTLKAYCGI
ncbi:unnamed protein product, partial [Thlaspi arvense]